MFKIIWVILKKNCKNYAIFIILNKTRTEINHYLQNHIKNNEDYKEEIETLNINKCFYFII